MKNSSQILSKLQHQPQFSKLAQFACLERIQSLFPPHLTRLVDYGYFKNNIIYFVLKHPGAKQEFDIIIESIKTPLKQITPPECLNLDFYDIRAYVLHKPSRVQSLIRHSVPHYKERSEAKFTNTVTSEKLHALFEQIRTSIHDRNT